MIQYTQLAKQYDVQKAKEIYLANPVDVKNFELDISNDPNNPGAVSLIVAEDTLSQYSDPVRFNILEQLWSIAQVINEVVPCSIKRVWYLKGKS